MILPYAEPFIDFHTHLFPNKLQRAIWKWFHTRVGWHFWFERPWVEAVAFLEAIPTLERYVCFGYAHKPDIARELNRFYAAIPAHSPKAVPLMCAHQDDPDLAGLVDEGLALGLPGVKLHCQVQRVSPADRRFDPLYRRLSEVGGLVLLHAGTGPFPEEHLGFEACVPLLRRFPDLTVVVAHLGCFEAERFLGAALEHPNLYLDTSYTFIDNPSNRMDAPVERVCAAAHKVLFASDFPGICHPYADAVAAIAALPLESGARRRVFRDNAQRLLARGGVE